MNEPAYPPPWSQDGRDHVVPPRVRVRRPQMACTRRRGTERGSPRVSSLARCVGQPGPGAPPSICSDGRCFGGPSTPALGDDYRSTRPSALRSSQRPFGGLTTTRQRSTSSPGPRFYDPCSTHSPSDSTGHRPPRRPSPASGRPSTAPWPTRSSWSSSQTHPMDRIHSPRAQHTDVVDRRVVVNPQQAASLLQAVRTIHPSLEAYFACLYYAGLRPAEARHLRESNLRLPETGWGSLHLEGSTPTAGGEWTDSGKSDEDRQLKHRTRKDTREVPASPELVAILRRHLARFPSGPDGRIFVTRTGRAGTPLAGPYATPQSMGIVYRVWDQARRESLSPLLYSSPLARRPYDLRHAAVSPVAQRRRARHPGRRVGRSQRQRPAPRLRQVHLRPGRGRQQRVQAALEPPAPAAGRLRARDSARIPHRPPYTAAHSR